MTYQKYYYAEPADFSFVNKPSAALPMATEVGVELPDARYVKEQIYEAFLTATYKNYRVRGVVLGARWYLALGASEFDGVKVWMDPTMEYGAHFLFDFYDAQHIFLKRHKDPAKALAWSALDDEEALKKLADWTAEHRSNEDAEILLRGVQILKELRGV